MKQRFLRLSVIEKDGDEPQVDVPGYVFILLDELGEKNEHLVERIANLLPSLELSAPK